MRTPDSDALVMVFTPADRDALLAHYARVAPIWLGFFGPIPIVTGFVPDWNSGTAVFEGLVTKALPPSIATVEVRTTRRVGRYIALAENAILWQAHRGAIEFLSWAPTRQDPDAMAFARILLSPSGTATQAMVKEAALALKGALAEQEIGAIPVMGGVDGISLWLPFSDAPAYPPVRAWLHHVAEEAERRQPTLFSVERPLSERGNRVHVAVESNAPGRYSALPYSLRGYDGLPMVTPITWSQLEAYDNGEDSAFTSQARLHEHGDLFADGLAPLREQRAKAVTAPFKAGAPVTMWLTSLDLAPRGRIVRAAIEILADGKPRDADTLLEEAIARGVVPKSTTRKYVYSALIEYIARSKGHDRKPLIVQDSDRRFRINHPADDWPAPKHPPAPRRLIPHAAELIQHLRATSIGTEPAAFELAVCDAFRALGFIATHVGGEAAPDGYLDAPLGPLGYRVMLECKTASGVVAQPDAVEASKYRDAYRAQYATLIGPAFGEHIALAGELRTHGVSAFSVDDIARLLDPASDPAEMHALFEPGFAADRLADLLWSRSHGAAKRVAVVVETLLAVGWREQVEAATTGDPADAPALNEDAAMLLVDQVLVGEEGSQQPCTRTEIRAAFAFLTSPMVGKASWLGENRAGVILTEPASGSGATK